MDNLTNKEKNRINRINEYTRQMRFGEKIDYLIRNVGDALKAGTPVNAANAVGTLTVAVQPTVGDIFTIGVTPYTFIANGETPVEGEIALGVDLPATKLVIVTAINGSDSVNEAHPLVTAAAFSANNCVLTAIVPGVAGNAIPTTSTFDNVGNKFVAATLGSGVDGTVGELNDSYIDDTNIYFAIAANTITGKNWRKLVLQTL